MGDGCQPCLSLMGVILEELVVEGCRVRELNAGERRGEDKARLTNVSVAVLLADVA